MRDWRIFRLDPSNSDTVAGALSGLYQVDRQAFRSQDQYGLELLKLALLQPQAFWVAAAEDAIVGYLSIFTLRSSRLYNKLTEEAKQGILDLPDLIHDYYSDIVSSAVSDLSTVHLYIDAIAIAKVKGITSEERTSIRERLIDAAKRDLSLVNKATLCAIAVRPAVTKVLKQLALQHMGGRRESVVGDTKYRELFVSKDISSKRFNAIMNGLSMFKSNLRFGLRFRYDQLLGSPTVDVFVEPKS